MIGRKEVDDAASDDDANFGHFSLFMETEKGAESSKVDGFVLKIMADLVLPECSHQDLSFKHRSSNSILRA